MNLLIHIISNLVLIAIISFFDKKTPFKKIFLLVILSNFIDLDHIVANPVYDPSRCSINFHPLHSWYLFPVYLVGIFLKKYKYLFYGIILHLILDKIDCLTYI